ncbi:hypothetical protein QRX60_29875 [Amycolatopsis mongoliensis]|uniref:Uncharacterized protein n=1 Tax=Amycolatopsis mongoliensis TaxID=715475 RepID=A0A9Y2JJ02_9PSEU|nr:hypothetical protein [Amycolatopsis sp. 4-36]WIX98266.1 hypothetical protein QRX60_29875 [Amycolatopsis sp. 4-36]
MPGGLRALGDEVAESGAGGLAARDDHRGSSQQSGEGRAIAAVDRAGAGADQLGDLRAVLGGHHGTTPSRSR